MAGIRGLLLCGGTSSRFGSDKLFAVVENSHPGVGRGPIAEAIVVRSARSLLSGIGNALAIIPPGAAKLREVLESAGCEILESPRTARGLGASLAAGVAATADASGWIVALGDMPFIRAQTFAAVSARLEGGAAIAAPVLAGGRRGHPVGFAAALRHELVALDGDEGARAVIARHLDSVALVAVDDPGIVADIDTPADLTRLARAPGGETRSG